MKNVLLVGAHFDDAELGAGGTAAKLVEEGKNVYKLTLTDNVTLSEHLNLHVEYERSRRESSLACEVLGVKEIKDFAPADSCKLSYGMEIMQRVEDVLYKYNIDTVFAHFISDLNQDHVAASQICITAARHCDNVFFYQSNVYIFPSPFTPHFFFDISDFVEKKREALRKYTGDHNRYNALFETNIERNHVWGYSNRCEYAEGFMVHKFLNR